MFRPKRQLSTVRLTNNVASQQLVIEASNEHDGYSKMCQAEYSSLHPNDSTSIKGVELDEMNEAQLADGSENYCDICRRIIDSASASKCVQCSTLIAI